MNLAIVLTESVRMKYLGLIFQTLKVDGTVILSVLGRVFATGQQESASASQDTKAKGVREQHVLAIVLDMEYANI